MKTNSAGLLIFVSLFIAADAFYYFFSGDYQKSGSLRNILAGIQFFAGICGALFFIFRFSRGGKKTLDDVNEPDN